MLLLRRKRFFGPHAEEIAFQFSKEREDRDDNFGLHVVLGEIQSLFKTDDADRPLHQRIDQRNHFRGTASSSGQFRHDERVVHFEDGEHFVKASVLCRFARRDGHLQERLDVELLFPGKFVDRSLLV